MCPLCMTGAALIATGSVSAAGLAALLAKVARAGGGAPRVARKHDSMQMARQQSADSDTLARVRCAQQPSRRAL